MSSLISFFEDILFPSFCVLCKKDGSRLCHYCIHTLQRSPLVCPFCTTITDQYYTCMPCVKKRTLTSAYSLYSYDDPRVKKIIEHIKFSGEFALLNNIQNKVGSAFEEFTDMKDIDAIIPIPINRQRFIERGYNQAELIARICSNISGIPMVKCLHVKKVYTQHKLNREKRLENLDKRFGVKPFAKSIKHAIVVDDILTTGGTLEAASISLRKVGVKQISAFTIARQEKHNT